RRLRRCPYPADRTDAIDLESPADPEQDGQGYSEVRVVLVFLLVGCGLDFDLDPQEPAGPPPQKVAVSESFVQGPLPKVDLLLVIDDTASMAQEQAALAGSFAALLDDLDGLGIGWQLGVVTTDMNGADAGWLRGSPYVLTPGTPDRDAAFAATVQVGTSGSGPEAGLAAAATALDLAVGDGPN